MSKLDERAIATTGRGLTRVKPSRVFVTFSVEGEGSTASEAKNRVQAKLTSALPYVETESKILSDVPYIYSLPTKEGSTKKLVKATRTFRVLLNNMDTAATFVDVVVDRGATAIDDVRFDVTDDQSLVATKEALTEATKAALAKANAVCKAIGADSVAVMRVDENKAEFGYSSGREMAVMSEPRSVPAISPGLINFEASVTMTCRFVQK